MDRNITMAVNTDIQLFKEKNICTTWDGQTEKWYYSVQDVLVVLTGSNNSKQYIKRCVPLILNFYPKECNFMVDMIERVVESDDPKKKMKKAGKRPSEESEELRLRYYLIRIIWNSHPIVGLG